MLRRDLERVPDLAVLQRCHRELFPCLLQSRAAGPRTGRYDLLLASSGSAVRAGSGGEAGWLADLRDRVRQLALPQAGQAPFVGGFLLLLCYEMARAFEPVLRLPDPALELPVALALRVPVAVLVDHSRARATVYGEPASAALFDEVLDAVHGGHDLVPEILPGFAVEEEPPARFLDGVAEIRERIAAGELFQANLSRGWRARADAGFDPLALHARLAAVNPAPFAASLWQPDFVLASSSPERLLRVADGFAETRPIAGTRPRLGDDAGQARELLSDPKERAEHVMLIDLERNDLGRVCVPGSIEVDEFCSVESYAHVHHIVSNVRGRLCPDRDALDALAAVFPGGTITGCPKIHCMRVLAELEGVGRGAYTGSLALLQRDGRMDSNILIRTLVAVAGEVHFRAGCGIVADSVPERELHESRAKARGLLRALGVPG